MILGILYNWLCFFCVIGQDEYVERDTVYGKVRGFLVTAFDDHVVEKYLGIPYAKPPLGKLRFEVRALNSYLLIL